MSRLPSCLLAACLAACPLEGQKKPVTAAAVVASQTAHRAPEIHWSPDGRSFVFERDRRLWRYDIREKSETPLLSLDALPSRSAAESPARPFEWRNRRVKEPPVQWFPGGRSLLISEGGDLFRYEFASGSWTRLTSTPEEEGDPKLSPDGTRISFRRGADLYCMEISTRRVTRLTADGSETVGNGRLDWVYPEELDLGTAHWWSPDSRLIAYLQFDVSRQPLYPHADLLAGVPLYEPQRYPSAGQPNARVRLGVVRPSGGRTRWLGVESGEDALLARVQWHPQGQSLFVQRLNRVQNRLDLLRADAATGRVRLLLREEDPHWINAGDFLYFLKGGAEFLWGSERDGFRRLYRHSADGALLAQLTSGPWEVTQLAGVAEARGEVFYVSTEASPLERHLFAVELGGGGKRRITQQPGTHAISMGADAAFYVDTFSSLNTPPRRSVHTLDGALWSVCGEADDSLREQYERLPVEIAPVKAADGETLYARLIRPAGFRPGLLYPAVVMVYGGPGSQAVLNQWEGLDPGQLLAARGFAVWQLDNRGSAGRGHQWESALFRRFGARELADQTDGLNHLLAMGFVDRARVGVYGWSYGGFMTLYSLLHAPGLFAAGVAGAPVTDWTNYDTIYTERYLGLPAENEEGYRLSSPRHFAANLKASLLLIHNLEDDNVTFRNTLQMADALQRAGKQFEMLVYPQKAHGLTGLHREHMLEAVARFFERELKP